MRNHSFSSLSTAYEHEMDHRLDEDDSYDLNVSVSSLAKLNRRKPQVSTILKLNLIVVLIISLFMKLTVVSIYNGSLGAFLALKLMTHGLILYTFLKKHYISLQLLFVLDVILFVIFLLFEFLLFVSNFAITIIQHKYKKKLSIIDIWLMILIAAIDLLILVMVAIVLENYRRPKERLQQLEAKLVTVVHNGRLLASQMCKSGSYLLGFVCNSSTAANQSAGHSATHSTNNNGMLQNGTPTVYRDSSNPNQRISCINTHEEASSFSFNDDEYVHYSSLDINDDEMDNNRFHSFSDFYNFNNRNANQTVNNCNDRNNTNSTVACSTTNSINSNPPTVSNAQLSSLSNIQSANIANNTLSSTSSNLASGGLTNTSTTLSSLLTTTLNNNLAILNNLTNSVTTTGIPSLTTLASSHFGTSIVSTQSQSSNNQSKESNKSLFERIGTNPFKSNGLNNSTISAIVNSNTISASNSISGHQTNNNNSSSTEENENTYVHMYQSNVDEDGEPIDGLLRCTRATVINNAESGSNSTSQTVVQMNRNMAERALNCNCKPVYI